MSCNTWKIVRYGILLFRVSKQEKTARAPQVYVCRRLNVLMLTCIKHQYKSLLKHE